MSIPFSVPSNKKEAFLKNRHMLLRNKTRSLIIAETNTSTPQAISSLLEKHNTGALLVSFGSLIQLAQRSCTLPLVCTIRPHGVSVADVVAIAQEHKLPLVAVCTEFSPEERHAHMERGFIERVIASAHAHGLLTYTHIHTPNTPALSLAETLTSLGSDFIIMTAPDAASPAQEAQVLKKIILQAPATKILCLQSGNDYLASAQAHLSIGGASGIVIKAQDCVSEESLETLITSL